MGLKNIKNMFEKINKASRNILNKIAQKKIERSIKNERSKISKMENFAKFCFKISCFYIIPSYLIITRYLYYKENDPKFLRE